MKHKYGLGHFCETSLGLTLFQVIQHLSIKPATYSNEAATLFVQLFPLGVATADYLPSSHTIPESSSVTPTLCISSSAVTLSNTAVLPQNLSQLLSEL